MILYMLAGLPASGKSTWAREQLKVGDFAYISSDKIINAWALAKGETYSSIFLSHIDKAIDVMWQEARQAVELGTPIIWDQTNLTPTARHAKLVLCGRYHKVAIAFESPDHDLQLERLEKRGTPIRQDMLDNMRSGYSIPNLHEGFDEVHLIPLKGTIPPSSTYNGYTTYCK